MLKKAAAAILFLTLCFSVFATKTYVSNSTGVFRFYGFIESTISISIDDSMCPGTIDLTEADVSASSSGRKIAEWSMSAPGGTALINFSASRLSRDGESDNVGFWLLFPYSYEGVASSTVSGTMTLHVAGNGTVTGSGNSFENSDGAGGYLSIESSSQEIRFKLDDVYDSIPTGTYRTTVTVEITTGA